MPSRGKQPEILPPGPFAALKFRPLRETAGTAKGYHRLISEQRFGEAIDAYWDETIVMRWADGRVYRGLGTCSALIANLVHNVVVVQNTYHAPSLGAGTFLMEVVTRQRLRRTGELIEITRTWGHKVRSGKIIEISEHFQSLLLLYEGAAAVTEPAESGEQENGPSGEPSTSPIIGRTLVPFENAIAWLSDHGV